MRARQATHTLVSALKDSEAQPGSRPTQRSVMRTRLVSPSPSSAPPSLLALFHPAARRPGDHGVLTLRWELPDATGTQVRHRPDLVTTMLPTLYSRQPARLPRLRRFGSASDTRVLLTRPRGNCGSGEWFLGRTARVPF